MTVPEFRRDLLHGGWVHSHEEDTPGELVFRRPTHPFPPSRGRMSFELEPDGSYVESSPGPVDVPEESRGTWSVEGDKLILGEEGDRAGHSWQLADLNSDRLAVRR